MKRSQVKKSPSWKSSRLKGVEDKDETEEVKEVDDSTYETEGETTPETESEEESDSDKNEPSR